MGSSTGLSVIVPTHDGREAMTRNLIDTYLEARDHATLPSELIVVDSASGPASTELEEYCEKQAVVYLRGTQPAGEKRNRGAMEARYDALLFVDSDCMLTPATLREHERIFDLGDEVGAVTGPTELTGPITPLWRVLAWSGMYSQCFDHAHQYEQVLWGVTANICVRRRALERIGGFDEQIVTPVGGEDVDFGVRLTEAGFVIRTNDQALVRHAREHVTVPHVARSLFNYGRADSYLCQRHGRRIETYLDPVLLGLLSFAAGRLVHRRVGPALGWALAGWAAGALRRQAQQPYTPDGTQRTGGLADIPRRLAAGALDSCFDAGRLTESMRARRPDLAAKRFRYVDPDSFRPRRTRGKA